MDLVKLVNGEPRTSSDVVSKKFGIAHKEVLRKLQNFTVEIPLVTFNEMYDESSRDVRGREFKMYTMNRKGYMFLVMNISTKKAHQQKLDIIDAFDNMEKALLAIDSNSKDNEWLRARQQSKVMRLQCTDVIKDFVEYATAQGSKSAKFYYKHVTNATYKALGLIQYKKPKVREILDFMELSQLVTAENVAKRSIRKHMNNGEHYKAVFVLVKQDLINFGNTLYLTSDEG